MSTFTEAPEPLCIDEEPWQFLVELFEGTAWAAKLGAAELVTENFTYRQVPLSMEDLDALWESVSSAMDAFEGDHEKVRLLDLALHSIGAAMDGF